VDFSREHFPNSMQCHSINTPGKMAPAVARFDNPRYRSNTYLLSNADSALIVDPGEETAEEVSALLDELRLSSISILLTHEHFDHISGVPFLLHRFPTSALICLQACSERIVSPRLNLSRYLTGVDFACPPATATVEQLCFRLAWGASGWQFIPTPGHSAGSMCIRLGNLLFTGDTILPDGPGITRLPGGSAQQLRESLDRVRQVCEQDTVIYPGHGLPFHSPLGTGHGSPFSPSVSSSQGIRKDCSFA
jgi:hydroxyacylglutathione hydrolase